MGVAKAKRSEEGRKNIQTGSRTSGDVQQRRHHHHRQQGKHVAASSGGMIGFKGRASRRRSRAGLRRDVAKRR
jgi:hypothetical protein